MRDVKKEQRLGGDLNWPKLYFVPIKGDLTATSEIEKWTKVAILEAHPPNVDFQIAFKSGDFSQRLQAPVQTLNGQFGMRIGPGDVEFFAVPLARAAEVELRLVEVTTIDNPRYPDLPLY